MPSRYWIDGLDEHERRTKAQLEDERWVRRIRHGRWMASDLDAFRHDYTTRGAVLRMREHGDQYHLLQVYEWGPHSFAMLTPVELVEGPQTIRVIHVWDALRFNLLPHFPRPFRPDPLDHVLVVSRAHPAGDYVLVPAGEGAQWERRSGLPLGVRLTGC